VNHLPDPPLPFQLILATAETEAMAVLEDMGADQRFRLTFMTRFSARLLHSALNPTAAEQQAAERHT
jgi:hypothetical protein